MSFSWSITDKDGKDLLMEFTINGQALGLADESTPNSISAIRLAFSNIPYKHKLTEAAQDAVKTAQELVQHNLAFYEGPLHEDCPCCSCKRPPPEHFGFDIEQARSFLSIPPERVHRASGGW